MKEDDSPQPPHEPPPEGESDPVSGIVQELAYLYAADENVDLEAFLARQPAELRDEARRRCQDAIRLQKHLRRQGSSGSHAALPGRTVGDFRIVRELGRGGMGVVYLAWQETLSRHVALKLLPLNPEVPSRTVKRFRREATAAARLRHPGIVQVHSVGEADSALYIAMEYVAGRTLASHMNEEEGGPGSDREPWRLGGVRSRGHARRVATVAMEMAEALQYAHEHGVIHRDVKPSNVLIDERGHPHVLDFGLAKDLTAEGSITKSGDLAGTPYYMSPEQAMAKRVVVDHRSDVFSLGVVLYELLTRKRPFEGDTLQRILYEISFKTPLPLRRANPSVPRDLETICAKALEKDPAHRFQDAQAMASDLRRFLDHESILARPPAWPERARRALVRHRVPAAFTAVALLAAVLTPWLAGRLARDERVRAAMEPVRALAAVPELATEDVLAGWRELAPARGLRDELAPADRAALDRELGRLTARAEREKDAGLADLATALAPETQQRLPSFASGYRRLLAALELLPDDPELRAAAEVEAWYPRLSVRAAGAGAEVYLRRLDVLTGRYAAPEWIGTTPLVEHAIEPGHYRILVVAPGGQVELTRRLDEPQHRYVADVVLRPRAEVLAGMVHFPGGEFFFGAGEEPYAFPYHRRREEVDAFWIDEHEVSNAEYRAYVEATGHRRPEIWPNPYDPAWDELPVVGVDYRDAREYAEWAGKRLPTMFEWERATRGLEERVRPRSAEELPPEGYVVGRGAPLGELELTAFWAQAAETYLRGVEPVRSHPEAATPEGLYHPLGNVAEWTESIHAVRTSTGLVEPQLGWRVAVGAAWATTPATAVLYWKLPTDTSFEDRTLGFRCVVGDLGLR